jgi:large subunit ribosomal protein L15
MALALAQLKAYPTKRRKRVGRGDSSGHGTYSTRGLKGQRARTGGRKGLKRRGLKQFLLQIPKHKGFKSLSDKPAVVFIDDVAKKFDNNSLVTIQTMIAAGLVKKITRRVKLLGVGPCHKKLTVKIHGFSKPAKDAITKAGGTAQIIR